MSESLRDRALVQLTLWRLREFLREPEALFWVFAFPIILAFALGLAFKNRGPEPVQVAVESGPLAPAVVEALEAHGGIEVTTAAEGEAFEMLRTGRVTLVVRPGDPVVFRFDSTRTESQVARLVTGDALQRGAGRRDVRRIRDEQVSERGSRYIDFLLPGLLGLNIMGTGMWGVGFGLVKDRTNKLLKRLLASPMRRRSYLLSHVLARLAFLVFEVTAILGFGALVFDVPVRGSLLLVVAVCILGAMAFAGLGLLVASRQKTIEGVSGLMNLVMVPMWIGSGVFFAYTHFPDFIQPALRILPLTALNDALRAVLLEGAGLAAVAVPVALLVAWTVVSFVVALRIFRWE
jgi:ABC-type multidrug transport system permease subunit